MAGNEIEIEVEVKEKEVEIDIELNTQQVEEQVKNVSNTLAGLEKTSNTFADGIKNAMGSIAGGVSTVLGDMGSLFTEAFTITSMEEYAAAASRFGEDLAGDLFSLQTNLDGLKSSIVDSVAPIAEVFIPLFDDAILTVSRFVDDAAKVCNALFDGGVGLDTLDQSIGNTELTLNDTVSPQLQTIIQKVLSLTESLKTIDFSPVADGIGRLGGAFMPLTQELFSGLEWAFINVFTPLAAWAIEDLLPAFLGLLSGAMNLLNETIIALQPLAAWLWDNLLHPIAEWTGGVIVDTLQWLSEKLALISDWISENQALIEVITIVIGSFAAAWVLVNGATSLWSGVGAAATAVTTAFGAAVNFLTSPIGLVVIAVGALIGIIALLVKNWDTVKEVAANVWEWIKSIWNGIVSWFQEKIIDPLVNGFKGMINGIIGFINGMISTIIDGVNFIIRALNKISFDVPDWVPGIGGMTLGFSIKEVTAPKIPLLAQGAVLPANKPFLAMVGDQRHGTNVEAPLTTIQEAVALAMEDQFAGMMAGFEASVAVQKQILQAVLGIEIGDNTIGQAAARYNRKMAIIKGGM